MVILKMIYLKKHIHKTMVILKMIYLKKKTSYGDFEDDLSQKKHP